MTLTLNGTPHQITVSQEWDWYDACLDPYVSLMVGSGRTKKAAVERLAAVVGRSNER